MQNMMIGVDLAKNVFQVHVASRAGEVQCRKKLSRKQFSAFMAQQEPSLVIFEACGSAHYWAREMEALDHEVRLIAPQYVRPFDEAHAMQNAVGSEEGRGGQTLPAGPCGPPAATGRTPRSRLLHLGHGCHERAQPGLCRAAGALGAGPRIPLPKPRELRFCDGSRRCRCHGGGRARSQDARALHCACPKCLMASAAIAALTSSQ